MYCYKCGEFLEPSPANVNKDNKPVCPECRTYKDED